MFFVENTGLRDLTLSDLPRVWRRASRLLAPRRARRPPPPGVRIVSPLVLPPTQPAFRALNAGFLLPRLAARLRALGLKPGAAAVCYLPTRTTLDLLALARPGTVVYDCVDNLHGLPNKPADLRETEDELMRRSALVLTTSQTLFEERVGRHPKVVKLHHGAAEEFFRDAPAPAEYRRFCYFGTLWHAVDYAALAALGAAGFEVDLIGPQKEPVPPLPPSVRLLPALPHEELPAALAGYHGLLLPYAKTDYNVGVIPAKTYECLATGLPVIASPLPALRELSGVLYRADDPGDWVAAARRLKETETPERRAARVAAARERSAPAQFRRLQALVSEALAAPPGRAAEAGAEAAKPAALFLSGFTWIGLLYGLARVSTLLTQVAAGRLLGPLEYGRANLVIALAAYLQVLPMLGFPTALSKFVAAEEDEEGRSRLISTALAGFALWAALAQACIWPARHALARALSVPPDAMLLGLAFAFCTAAYVVASSPLLGLRRFERRGTAETVYGLAAPLALAMLVWAGERTHRAMIEALGISLAVATLYSLAALRPYLRRVFDARLFLSVFGFAAVASLNLLAAACVLAPGRIILHRHFAPHEVGVFSAYFTATCQVSLALVYMVTAVVIPVAGRPEGQDASWRALGRYGWALTAAAWAFFMAGGAVALALFGRQYPFRWEWLAVFSAAAALILVHGAAAAVFSARNMRGLWLSVAGSLLAGGANVALGLVLIPRYGIAGAAASLASGYALGLLSYAGFRRARA